MERQQQLMAQLTDLTNELVWINRPAMEKELQGYKLNEIDLIEKIALIPNPNVTKLAAASYMTRGAISKLTKKMIEKGLIENYQSPENKKKIYFRLTAAGDTLNRRHQKLHEEFAQRDAAAFVNMTDEEFDTVFRFIGRYREHLEHMLKDS